MSNSRIANETHDNPILAETNSDFYKDLLLEIDRWCGHLNMQRISTRFTMITLKESVLLARQYQLLDSLHGLFGASVNLAILDAPIGIYNALSVALFALRFLIHTALILRDTCLAPEGTKWAHLCEGLKNDQYRLVNDGVWATINALTNYASYFKLSNPVATTLMGGFLVFDVMWTGYAWYLLELDYKDKRNRYKNDNQLRQLESDTEKTRALLQFCLMAAFIMVASFSAAILLAPPALVPVCFFICNIAIAMYLSCEQFGVYRQKCMIQQQEPNQSLQQDVDNAWFDLQQTMLKNTLMPFVIIGAFTLNVPLAIGLTLAYIAYEQGLAAYLPDLSSVFSGQNNQNQQSYSAAK